MAEAFLLILSAICISVSIGVSLQLLCALYCCESGYKIKSRWFKIPSICASICYTATSIMLIFIGRTTKQQQWSRDDNVAISVLILLAFVILAKVSIYISILSRLYLTFRQSSFLMRKSMLRFMMAVLSLFLLSGLYWNWLLYRQYVLADTPSYFQIQFGVVSVTFVICDFVSSVVMLMLFIQKLYRVILERRRSVTKIARGSCKSVVPQFDRFDLKFIDMITKYTVLSSWQIVTTQCGLLSLVMVGHICQWHYQFVEKTGRGEWGTLHHYFFVLLGMDIVVNSVTLVLYYEFCRGCYWTMCGKIHECCRGCIVRCANSMVWRQLSSSLTPFDPTSSQYVPMSK